MNGSLRTGAIWVLVLVLPVCLAFPAPPCAAASVSLGRADLKILGAGEREEVSDAAAAGDINGDGYSDIVVGSRLAASAQGDPGVGRAFLVYGAPNLPAVIDLASLGSRGVVLVVAGARQAMHLGHAVAEAGDLNGDGHPDFMVSAPDSSERGSQTGSVFVVFGGAPLASPFDLGSLGSRGLKITGPAAGSAAGSSLARAGDLNGDGFDDILVGAEGFSPPGRGGAGAVFVVFGSDSLPSSIDLAALGSRGVAVHGSDPGDGLGFAVGDLGDFNGDGRPDFIAAAPALFSPGRVGRAYVIFGRAAPPAVLDLRSLGGAGIVLEGVERGDFTGSDVSCGGDFNGDGFGDALIGAELSSPPGRPSGGRTFLVFGGEGLPSTVQLAGLGSGGVVFEGLGGNDHSGHSVACVGDFSGDGRSDLMIGADKAQPQGLGNSGQSFLAFGRPSPPAVISLGALGAGGLSLDGEHAGDRSGHVVAGAGDVDGDGGLEVLVVSREASPSVAGGSRHRAGVVYVFLGNPLPAPAGLACAITARNTVSLAWTLPGGTQAVPFDVIRIDRNGVTVATLPWDALGHEDLLPPFGVVVYEVFGVLNGRPSLPARCQVSVEVQPPFALNCTTVDGVVEMTWLHAQVVDATKISRDGELIATLPGSPTAYRDAAPPGEHLYQVTAVVGSEVSDAAVCRAVVPAPVADLRCSAAGSTVLLSWSNVDLDATGIRILRDGQEVAVVAGGAVTFVDNEVEPGSHLYEVQTLSGDHSSLTAACAVVALRPVEGLAGASVAGALGLQWTVTEVYDRIEVFRDGLLVATLPGGATSFSETLPPGIYHYSVVGSAGGNSSPPVGIVVVVPAPVTDVTCLADGAIATVTFSHPGGHDALEVTRSGGGAGEVSFVLPPEARSFQDALPGPGTYLYRLVVVQGNGRSAAAECSLKAPASPAPLDCALVGGTLRISWSRNSPYDGVEVVVNGEKRPLLPGDATTVTYDLGPVGSARVEVRGLCAGSRSEPARCDPHESGVPFNFSCLARGLVIALSWENAGPYDSLEVERNGAVVALLAGDAVSFEDTVPGPGAYLYRLRGVVGDLRTLPAVCHLRVSEAPADLRCSTDGETVTLHWTPLGEHHAVLIERNGSPYAVLAAGATTFTDSSPLVGGTVYSVRLSHLGSAGIAATCTVEVLEAPRDLTCRAEGDGVILSWSDPEDYTALVIFRNGSEVSPPGGLPGTASSFVDRPVAPGRYLYQVQGFSGAEAKSAPAECEVEVIVFPIRLICSSQDGAACLRWENPRSYDAIQVLRDGEPVASLPGAATSFCEEGLLPGEYVYEVRGLAGESASLASACRVVVPREPGDLRCLQQGSDVLLSWTPAGEYDAVSIHRDGDLWSVASGNATSFLDREVPLGVHTYEVRGGVGGDFSRPAVCEVIMLAPPRGLSCTQEGQGSSVKVCWTPGAEYDEVLVRRNGELLATLPGDQTCYENHDIAPGVYVYQVSGREGSDESAASSCTAIVIAGVFGLRCQVDGEQAALAWTNGAPYDEIELYRKRPSQSEASLLAVLPGSRTSFVDAPLVELGEYVYSLRGRLGGNLSPQVSCSAARLRPPADLRCEAANTSVFSSDVVLTWVRGEAYEAVTVRRNGNLLATLPGDAQRYEDRVLGVGTYEYEVRGTADGDTSSPARCTVRVRLFPPSVTALHCLIEAGTARLSWTSGPADETRIYRRAPGQGAATLLATLPGTPGSYTDSTVTAPGDYLYEVTTVKEGLESSRAFCEVHKPRAPAGLICRAANLGVTDGDVHLTWTNQEEYDSISVFRDGQRVAVLPGSATAYLDPDLPKGTYRYELQSGKGGNLSDRSETCQVEVPVQPPAVGDLRCSLDGGSTTLRWTSSAVYDGIEIRRQAPGDAGLSLLTVLPGDRTSYQDLGLTRAGTYRYTVTAVIGGGSSLAAECSATLPVAPRLDAACATLEAGPDGVDVLLRWENRDDYDSVLVIRTRTRPAPSQTISVSLRADQTAFLDRTMSDGEYDYVVVGVKDGGSAPSTPCHVVVDRPNFVRGELNNDRRHDIADAVFLFYYLFTGGPAPTCRDAADANDDGLVDIADAVWLIGWQFHGRPQPRPPFPSCGKDPTDDTQDCLAFPACP